MFLGRSLGEWEALARSSLDALTLIVLGIVTGGGLVRDAPIDVATVTCGLSLIVAGVLLFLDDLHDGESTSCRRWGDWFITGAVAIMIAIAL